jgi:repressor LexA
MGGSQMKEMSSRQRQVYDYIKKYHEENGISPSINNIADEMGLGITTIHTYVKTLKEKGFVINKSNVPRSLKVVPFQ